MIDFGNPDCKKIIKMISRLGNIENLERINKVSLPGGGGFNCWADVKEGKIHTIEDNPISWQGGGVIKGINLENLGETTKFVKVFIQPQIVDDKEVREVVFDLK